MMLLVMIAAVLAKSSNGRLDNAIGHSDSKDSESIPQPPHKNRMAHIPDPFKIKRKHNLPS